MKKRSKISLFTAAVLITVSQACDVNESENIFEGPDFKVITAQDALNEESTLLPINDENGMVVDIANYYDETPRVSFSFAKKSNIDSDQPQFFDFGDMSVNSIDMAKNTIEYVVDTGEGQDSVATVVGSKISYSVSIQEPSIGEIPTFYHVTATGSETFAPIDDAFEISEVLAFDVTNNLVSPGSEVVFSRTLDENHLVFVNLVSFSPTDSSVVDVSSLVVFSINDQLENDRFTISTDIWNAITEGIPNSTLSDYNLHVRVVENDLIEDHSIRAKYLSGENQGEFLYMSAFVRREMLRSFSLAL